MSIAVAFIYMSTEYTGQVINIELPLGIVLIIYYLVSGFIEEVKRVELK